MIYYPKILQKIFSSECNDDNVSVYVSSESYATDGSVEEFENIGEMYLDKELKVNDKSIKKANKQRVLKNRLIRLLEGQYD